MLRTWSFAALAAVALLLARPAVADEQKPPEKADPSLDEARRHLNAAKIHYYLAEYAQAAEEYTIVYRLKPIPAILYNIAQAWRQAGQYEKSKHFYGVFLQESPDQTKKPIIEKAIKEMDELLAKDKRARDLAPNGLAQAPPFTPSPGTAPGGATPSATTPQAAGLAPPPAGTTPPAAVTKPAPTLNFGSPAVETAAAKRHRTWTWVAAGGTAVAFVAGGAFGYKTVNGASSSDARTANILYGVGGVLALVSAGLFIFEF